MADHLEGPFGSNLPGFWYLAGPYSGTEEEMANRATAHKKASVFLAGESIWNYSPIAYWHDLAKEHFLPTSYEYWLDFNLEMLSAAGKMILLELPGWQKSRGVQAELFECARRDFPVWGMSTEKNQIDFRRLIPGEAYVEAMRTHP